jgi:hypothetical protein
MRANNAFSAARRNALRMFGVGVAGTVVGVAVGANKVFAKQFAGPVNPVQLPEMVYDPKLQMMVDPKTGLPIYHNPQMLASSNATVTSGCANCPKCDDHCDG